MNAFSRILFFGIFLVIASGVGFLLVRNGAFLPVELTIEERGPFVVLGKTHVGPYHKIISDLEDVENWAKSAKVNCAETFAEFFDDPNIVEQERMKSEVGCLIERAPDKIPAEFKTRIIARRKYIVAKYHGSPALGPYKVYNKIDDEKKANHLESNGSPLEIYKVLSPSELETTYLFPVK